MTLEEILKKEDIKEYDFPIWKMSQTQLNKEFSSEASNKPVATRIIKNIIWQVYTWIQAGKHEPIKGNLRSFWYLRVKAPLGKVGLLDDPTDHSETMSKLFSELSRDYKLFKYIDFGFIDDNWETRRIGETNPHVIVFSEKNGFFYYLKELYQEFDVTVAALGGQPSILSTEYLVSHVLKKCLSDQIFYTLSVVDYDPSGWLIEQNFQSLLYEQGLTDIVSKSIVQPSLYTSEEIELYRYPLSKSSKAQKINKKWLEATQGVNGESYGLEADSLPKDRLMDAIKVELTKLKEIGVLREGKVQN